MTAITFEALGFSKEQIAERIIDAAVDRMLHSRYQDEDGEDVIDVSEFQRRIEKKIVERIDAAVTRVADENIAPQVNSLIENIIIQQTNEWGEKRGQQMTLIQYLTSRAEAWMTEQVDYNGKPKGQDSYQWRPNTTRMAYMVNSHLQHSIESAMKDALAQANSTMAKGLHEACRVAINNVAAQFAIVAKAGK